MPKVIHKKNGTIHSVFIGRPSKYGNPFIIGRDGTREEVISKYKEWLLSQPKLIEQAKRELKGKDLCCWCAPLPCHGDVLLEIANQIEEPSCLVF